MDNSEPKNKPSSSSSSVTVCAKRAREDDDKPTAAEDASDLCASCQPGADDDFLWNTDDGTRTMCVIVNPVGELKCHATIKGEELRATLGLPSHWKHRKASSRSLAEQFKWKYLLSCDLEAICRYARPDSMLESAFCLFDVDTGKVVKKDDFQFSVKGDYSPGTLKWLCEKGLLQRFEVKRERNKNADNREAVVWMFEFLHNIQLEYGDSMLVLFYPSAYDWQFINTYLYQYCGENPLGYQARDLDSMAMGVFGEQWNKLETEWTNEIKGDETSEELHHYRSMNISDHDARYDAYVQGRLGLRVITHTA